MKRRVLVLLLALVLVGAYFLAVVPTGALLAQRRKINATEQRSEVISAQNRKLAAHIKELKTDAEIERLAREQYNLVRPGEEAYAILPSPNRAAPRSTGKMQKNEKGFWSRIWDGATFWS